MKAGAGPGAGVLSGSVALGPHSALKDRQRMPSFSSENARADAESGLPLQPQPQHQSQTIEVRDPQTPVRLGIGVGWAGGVGASLPLRADC